MKISQQKKNKIQLAVDGGVGKTNGQRDLFHHGETHGKDCLVIYIDDNRVVSRLFKFQVVNFINEVDALGRAG